MRNRKLICIGIVAAAIIGGWMTNLSTVDRNNRARLSALTQELNGTFDSTSRQVPFGGSEIAIAFRNVVFAKNDLQKFTEALIPCRKHSIVIHFQNTNVTDEHVYILRQSVPKCRIIFDHYRKDIEQPRIRNAS